MLEWWERPYEDHGRGPAVFDCWGLFREAYRRDFGIVLPDYGDGYGASDDTTAVGELIRREIRQWTPVDSPQQGDLVILRIARRPFHCAYCLGSEMLHTLPNTGAVIEPMNALRWARRIEGCYRWTPSE